MHSQNTRNLVSKFLSAADQILSRIDPMIDPLIDRLENKFLSLTHQIGYRCDYEIDGDPENGREAKGVLYMAANVPASQFSNIWEDLLDVSRTRNCEIRTNNSFSFCIIIEDERDITEIKRTLDKHNIPNRTRQSMRQHFPALD